MLLSFPQHTALALGGGMLLRGFAWQDAADANALKTRIADAILRPGGVLGAAERGSFTVKPMFTRAGGPRAFPFAEDGLSGYEASLALTLRHRAGDMRCLLQPEAPLGGVVWVGDTPRGFALLSLPCAVVRGVTAEAADGQPAGLRVTLDALPPDPEALAPPCALALFEEADR